MAAEPRELLLACSWGRRRFEINVSEELTIDELRVLLDEKIDVEPAHQKLFFQGRKLDPRLSGKLADLSLSARHVLNIIGRPRKQVPQREEDVTLATRRLTPRSTPETSLYAFKAAAPYGLTITALSRESVRISWRRPRQKELTVIQYELFVNGETKPAYTGASTSVDLDHEVSEDYVYRVRAITSIGDSSFSAPTSMADCQLLCCICLDSMPAADAVFCSAAGLLPEQEFPPHCVDRECFLEHADWRLANGAIEIHCPDSRCRATWDYLHLKSLFGKGELLERLDHNIQVAAELAITDKVSCLACGYWEEADQATLQQLGYIFACANCSKTWCVKCDPPMEVVATMPHRCRLSVPRREMEELLTRASTIPCPNPNCDQVIGEIEDRQNCNVLTCPNVECGMRLCALCGKNLGYDGQVAHDTFPHDSQATGRTCTLFGPDSFVRARRERIQVELIKLSRSMVDATQWQRTIAESYDLLQMHDLKLSPRSQQCPQALQRSMERKGYSMEGGPLDPPPSPREDEDQKDACTIS